MLLEPLTLILVYKRLNQPNNIKPKGLREEYVKGKVISIHTTIETVSLVCGCIIFRFPKILFSG